MKKPTFLPIFKLALLILVIGFLSKPTLACTIVSAIAQNGQVWNCNNEDGPDGIANFINVFPKTGNSKYGYYTLSYLSPKYGQGSSLQGGTNEAGLTFDFNEINWVKKFDPKSKKIFPQGEEAILTHILATMDSVQEVVNFFKIYWFQNGFRGAQMHVADRQGTFAIISASGIKITQGKPLISTNFDICAKEDSSSCWRYEKATSKLAMEKVNLSTMMALCKETENQTLYSNVQNLTTGDIWFFSKHDPQHTIKINIRKMLSRGQKSYSFSDLRSLTNKPLAYKWVPLIPTVVADSIKQRYDGTFGNKLMGKIVVEVHHDGIRITGPDGKAEIFQPQSENVFFKPEEDVKIEFLTDKETGQMTLRVYENGFWSLSAVRKSSK